VRPFLLSSFVTCVLHTARISNVDVIMNCDKWKWRWIFKKSTSDSLSLSWVLVAQWIVRPFLLSSFVTCVLHTARISNVDVIMNCDKWKWRWIQKKHLRFTFIFMSSLVQNIDFYQTSSPYSYTMARSNSLIY